MLRTCLQSRFLSDVRLPLSGNKLRQRLRAGNKVATKAEQLCEGGKVGGGRGTGTLPAMLAPMPATTPRHNAAAEGVISVRLKCSIKNDATTAAHQQGHKVSALQASATTSTLKQHVPAAINSSHMKSSSSCTSSAHSKCTSPTDESLAQCVAKLCCLAAGAVAYSEVAM